MFDLPPLILYQAFGRAYGLMSPIIKYMQSHNNPRLMLSLNKRPTSPIWGGKEIKIIKIKSKLKILTNFLEKLF